MSVSREIAKSSARGSLYLFIGGTLSTGITALTSILIGRLLGPDNYGLYNLSLTPAQLLFIASGFGVNIALIKFVSEGERRGDYHRIRHLIKTALLFQVSLGLILSLVLSINSGFFATHLINRPEADLFVKITGIYVVGNLLFLTVNQSFIGLNRMDRSAIISLIQALSKFGVAIGLIILGFGVAGAVIGHSGSYLLGGIVGLLLLYILVKGFGNKMDAVDDPSYMGLLDEMIRYGFPVYLSGIIMNFLGVYRNYLLSIFASNVEIGNFVAAMNMTSSIMIFMTPISTVLFPAFSKLDIDREIDVIRDLFRHAVKYSTIIILPIAMFIIFLSRDVTYLFYGSSYRGTPFYLSLAASQYLFVGIGFVILASFFNGVGETKTVFRIGVLRLIISLIAYPILIYLYHVTGLLIAILMAVLFPILYGFSIARRKFGVSIDTRGIMRIYLASLFSSIITYIMRMNLDLGRSLYNTIFYGLFFLIIYVIFLTLFRGVSNRDLDVLETAFEDIKIVRWFIHVFFLLVRRLLKIFGGG